MLALLVAQYRRLDLAEDGLADAFEAAARTWDVVPDNPPAWLLTAARRRIVDRLRAEAVAARKLPLLAVEASLQEEAQRVMADAGEPVRDERLRLVLLCAHPSLPAGVGGRADAAAGARRADRGHRPAVPRPDADDGGPADPGPEAAGRRVLRDPGRPGAAGRGGGRRRLPGVHGRLRARLRARRASAPRSPARRSGWCGCCARVLPYDDVELDALLALMLLQHSRRDARVVDGRLVLLPDQDRSRVARSPRSPRRSTCCARGSTPRRRRTCSRR